MSVLLLSTYSNLYRFWTFMWCSKKPAINYVWIPLFLVHVWWQYIRFNYNKCTSIFFFVILPVRSKIKYRVKVLCNGRKLDDKTSRHCRTPFSQLNVIWNFLERWMDGTAIQAHFNYLSVMFQMTVWQRFILYMQEHWMKIRSKH